MARKKPYSVAIIGLGSAGLAAAETAAALGLRVVAIERGRAGGDSLWSGCIPSKTLIASARAASAARSSDRLGVRTGEVQVDGAAVWQRVRDVRDRIAAGSSSIERLRELGVDVREGPARLVGTRTVQIGDESIRARRIVIATGSRPRLPDVPGLAASDPLTTDTLWDLAEIPDRLVILGAGPSGVETAMALAQLGTDVTLIHRNGKILPHEDPILAGLVEERLRDAGVTLVARADALEATQVEQGARRLTVAIRPEDDGLADDPESIEERSFETPHLLVCCGRAPNLEALDIEGAGIDHGDEGILADSRSRTSAKRVYAVGDAAGRGHTHTAAFDGATAIRDIALPGAGRRAAGIPWCLFTDPELGHAGLTFAEALRRWPRKRVQRFERDLVNTDLGRVEGDPVGRVVVVTVSGRIAGVHLLARGAGEAIGGFQREVAARTRLTDLAQRIDAYPTHAIEVQRIAAWAAVDRARRARTWIPRLPGR